MRQEYPYWLIWVTLLVASVLSIVPLPDIVSSGRPAFVPLVTIFWMLAMPQYCGLFLAWVLGLLIDVLHGTLFGQHAIAMLCTGLAVTQWHRLMKMYPLWQQSFVVLVIITLYESVTLWIGSATGHMMPSLLHLLPAITSALLWPWLFGLFYNLRQRFIDI